LKRNGSLKEVEDRFSIDSFGARAGRFSAMLRRNRMTSYGWDSRVPALCPLALRRVAEPCIIPHETVFSDFEPAILDSEQNASDINQLGS
jgi:hypothetical protein